jgi:predicted nucleotide-binding protein
MHDSELERIKGEFRNLPSESPKRNRLLNELETVIRRALLNDTKRADKYIEESREIRFYPYFSTLREHPESWAQGIENMVQFIESVQFHIRTEVTMMPGMAAPKSTNTIFLVHGHDLAMLRDVEAFVRRIGITPIILMDEASRGGTVIEKFEQNAEVPFAVVLFSPDDVGRAYDAPKSALKRRPRQNAVLELGFFIGRLSRNNTALLVDSTLDAEVEYPSDLGGIIPIYYRPNSDWKVRLMREFKVSSIDHDPSKA